MCAAWAGGVWSVCEGIVVVVLGGVYMCVCGGVLCPFSPLSVSHRPAPCLWPIASWVMGRPIGVD